MKTQKALTLTELLVVIAILGIFATLLPAVSSNTKQEYERSLCLKHLRDLAQGTNIYMEDFDGNFSARCRTMEIMLAEFALSEIRE